MKIDLKKQIFYLALAAICLISISGTIVYRFYALNWLGILGSLILAAVGFYFFFKLFPKRTHYVSSDIEERFISKRRKADWKTPIFILLYLSLLLFSPFFLFEARTDQALTSPWQIVSAKFFIIYIISTGYLFWLILRNSRFTLWLLCIHYFFSFSVLWIVFKIGYGYDPFIHQATVALIDKQGAVDPKPFYYLGQYSLILSAHKFLFIPIVWLDKLLVPLLAAITLPPAIHLFLKKNLTGIQTLLPILLLLILPFSIFTLTVPQNLAYLFLILAIFFALTAEEITEKILSYLLAIAAIAAHPLAGIPALLFVIAVSIHRTPKEQFCFFPKNPKDEEICLSKPRRDVLIIKSHPPRDVHKTFKKAYKAAVNFVFKKNIFYILILALNTVCLPALFWLTQKNNSSAGIDAAAAGFSLPALAMPVRENIFLNSIYFFQGNLWLILILLSALAIYIAHRYRREYSDFILPAGFSLGLGIAYILTRLINFGALISYERDDYANRILIIAFIFLLPIIVILFSELLDRILRNKAWIKYSWLIFLVLLITISLYGSYPRRDNYFNSHGFAIGQNDLDAVDWIEKDANGEPYVVLANQQVSVGALWTFGFNRYLKDGLYFYPIPTGGPLYQIYLDMVYKKADRDTALKAADLTGVQNVYFAINKYWTGFDKIVEQAKIGADSYENLNNGEIYIFTYIKQP
jgi:hypothetical protein